MSHDFWWEIGEILASLMANWLIHFEWTEFFSLDTLGKDGRNLFQFFLKHKPHTLHHHFHFISFHFFFPRFFSSWLELPGWRFFLLLKLCRYFSLFFFFCSRSIQFCMPATRVCGHLNKFISIFIQYEFFSIILYKIMYEWMSEMQKREKSGERKEKIIEK